LVAFGFEQTPVPVSHTPATWHWSRAVQAVAVPGEHVPDWQVSPVVHALLSVHVVPLVAIGFEQTPVPVSQTPATWHWSVALQITGFEPTHSPVPLHASICVQAFPSLHAVPDVAGGPDSH
jgi:hypothetical protein